MWHCVCFLVLVGNRFWYFIRTECTINLCGCVGFLFVAGNSVVAGNSSPNYNTFLISYEQFLQENLIGLLYCDPIANVCISYDPTLFYSVSFYSESFSCTAQIHKLKFKSEYYLRKQQSHQKCEHRQSHFNFPNTDSKKISTWVSLLKRNNLLAKLCVLFKSKHWVLAKIRFIVCLGFF